MNYLRKYKYGINPKTGEEIILEARDRELISKIEDKVKNEFNIENISLDELESLDVEGKKKLSSIISGEIIKKLENILNEYQNSSNEDKRKLAIKIEQQYKISEEKLQIMLGNELRYSINKTAENILKEMYKDVINDTITSILENSKLSDKEKIFELNKKFNVVLSKEKVDNQNELLQDIIKNTTFDRILAQKTDEIANSMRWESKFFKDFIANNQKLTNRQIVIDEDDYIWYANENGKLKNQENIVGKISYVEEKYITKEENKNVQILDNFEVKTRDRKDSLNIQVWEGKKYKNGNTFIEEVVDDEKTVRVIHFEDEAFASPYVSKEAMKSSKKEDAYLKIDGTANKGTDTLIGIDFDISKKKEMFYLVFDGIDSKTGLEKIKVDIAEAINYGIYGHELRHGLSNQKGINDQRKNYQFYLDSNNRKHVTGEVKVNYYIDLIKKKEEIFNDIYDKVISEFERIPNKDTEILKDLKNQKSDLYTFFAEDLKKQIKKC